LSRPEAGLNASEEREQMHATEINKEKNRTTEVARPACSYPLETLMALQKILENGVPDAPDPRLRPAAQTNDAEKTLQPVFRPQSERNSMQAATNWKAKLRQWWMKLGKAKEADKGHSAQQTG
jgi:hypothetical protein